MKRPYIVAFSLLLCLPAAPLLAQTTIGGGSCTSGTPSGTYAVQITGKQVSSAGNFTNVFQAVGSATFDGLSKVTFSLLQDNTQVAATPLTWAGSYSVQSNCNGAVTITAGGNATFTMALYNTGSNFLMTGSDSTYNYAISGDTQPTGCSAGLLSGVYSVTATGYTLSGGLVSGAGDFSGLLQFDGTSNATANITVVGSSPSVLTGTYSMNSNCIGSATLSGGGKSYAVSMSVFTVTPATGTPVAISALYVSLAQTGKSISTGTSRAIFGQPTAAAATASDRGGFRELGDKLARLIDRDYSRQHGSERRPGMNQSRLALLAGLPLLLALPAGAQTISGGTCSTSTLKGSYSMLINGRGIAATGNLPTFVQGVGTAVFDGNGAATLSGIYNSNLAPGSPATASGTYTLGSNCSGTVTLSAGDQATYTIVVWSNGAQINLTGSDSKYVFSGSGSAVYPAACAASTLSGPYTYDAMGFTLTGTAVTGPANETGAFTFDGQGNMTGSYTPITGAGAGTPVTETGTYTVTSNCFATATMTTSAGQTNALNFAIVGQYGQNLDVIEANSQTVRTGSGHSAFTNPAQSIANVASYAVNATPPGSVFALFGVNLATKPANATQVPLPDTLLTTSVTVNGEPAPLFYADSGQIDAQMPWDIPGNTVASVIVKNGSSASNAAAVYVPATGTPGLSVFSTNRAVVTNQNGTSNSSAAGAAVGDEVVLYFTGGGPRSAAGKLTTGAAAPSGLSPLVSSAAPTISVGGVQATIAYIGLTPAGVGLYQANFYVPQIAKGTYPVVVTISGTASNTLGGPQQNPVMTVSN